MKVEVAIALMSLAGVALTAAGAFGGAWLQRLSAKDTADSSERAAVDTAQNALIDQLQEELTRYREYNDLRIAALEGRVEQLTNENRGYREFIGVQRDHMAQHGIPLPEWPTHLPR